MINTMRKILTNGTVLVLDVRTEHTENLTLVVEADGTVRALTDEQFAERLQKIQDKQEATPH